ncbi:MAG TPA: cytochrome P450 [Acidimicrobiales bacterium]|jgi:cytochrome P450
MVASPPLHDPAWWAGDPYPEFAALRAEDPVHRYEGEAGELWMITRHADVSAISKDPATFCSSRGILLTDLTRPALGTSIVSLDPPRHGRLRRLVSPSLSVRRVADLEDRVRAIARELLDAVDPGEVVDAVERLAIPLPILVIAELVGVPEEDTDRFRHWSDAAIAATTDLTAEIAALLGELYGYIVDVVRARQAEPAGDLVSVLAHGQVDGESLSDDEINMFVLTLLVAGNETTRTLVSNGLHALATHPDQRRRLVEDPGLIGCGVEELLRWEAPIMSFCRTATREVELGGRTLAEGDHVLLCYQSANRDEAAFGPTAGSLDVGRDPNPHLSFGYAEHYCMGAGLARLEGRVLLEEILARWPDYELAGEIERLPSRLARGVAHLPVLLEPG